MKFESRKIKIHKKIGGQWCGIWYNGFLYDADNLHVKRNRVNDFSSVIYIGYIDDMNFTCILFLSESSRNR